MIMDLFNSYEFYILEICILIENGITHEKAKAWTVEYFPKFRNAYINFLFYSK